MSNTLSKFYTAEQAEEGVKFFLDDLDGRKTDDWLLIKGSDSDSFLAAQRAYARGLSLIDEKDDAKKSQAQKKLLCEFAAALVVGWSFDDHFDQKSFADELMKAPAIREQIEAAAMERSNFLKKK